MLRPLLCWSLIQIWTRTQHTPETLDIYASNTTRLRKNTVSKQPLSKARRLSWRHSTHNNRKMRAKPKATRSSKTPQMDCLTLLCCHDLVARLFLCVASESMRVPLSHKHTHTYAIHIWLGFDKTGHKYYIATTTFKLQISKCKCVLRSIRKTHSSGFPDESTKHQKTTDKPEVVWLAVCVCVWRIKSRRIQAYIAGDYVLAVLCAYK